MEAAACCCLPLYGLWHLGRGLVMTIIGLVKSCFTVLPVTILLVPGWTATALSAWPHQVWLTFYYLATTRFIGPYLKTLVLIMLLPALLAYLIVVPVASILTAFGLGVLYVVGCTIAVNDLTAWEKLAFEGGDCVEHASKLVKEFWQFSWHSYFDVLRETGAPYYGEPFDISPLRLLYAITFALLWSLAAELVVVVDAALKGPFLLLRVLYDYCHEFYKQDLAIKCVWYPCWFIGVLLIPVAFALAFVGVLLAAFLGSFFTVCGISYSIPRISGTFKMTYHVLYSAFVEADTSVNHYVGCCLKTLDFPRPDRTAYPELDDFDVWIVDRRYDRTAASAATTPADPQRQSGAAGPPANPFQQQLLGTCLGLVRQVAGQYGWWSPRDFAEAEPFVFISLPTYLVLCLILLANGAENGVEVDLASVEAQAGSRSPEEDGLASRTEAAGSQGARKGLSSQDAKDMLERLVTMMGPAIGTSSAANPANLSKRFKRLKASPEELLYLKCQAVLGSTERMELALLPASVEAIGTQPPTEPRAVKAEPTSESADNEKSKEEPATVASEAITAQDGAALHEGGKVGVVLAVDGTSPASAVEESRDSSGDGGGAGNGMSRVQRPSTDARRAELHAFTAALQSIGICLSKRQAIKDVFKELMQTFALDA